LLAAGSGTRYGIPKALVDTGAGPWVLRALDALNGCDPLVVVVGARADDVVPLLPPGVTVLRNEEYEQGMGTSLRRGLRTLLRDEPTADAALVMLVDLPDVGAPVVRRIIAAGGTGEAARSRLVRAVYQGRPGHPVLIGRDHWSGVMTTATADEGARRYLRDHPPATVECGDLATGADLDRPPAAGGGPSGGPPTPDTIAVVSTPEPATLTHVDPTGAARMVDVSAKAVSAREAVATGVLRTTTEVADLLRQGGLPKGDALATARIAGIMAAKRTPDLVPLCHPIAISGVTLDLQVGEADVRISARVRTTDRTGVEMEALTAVAVAGLTLHDMVKAVDPAAVLDGVRVERKEGGKTGTWVRPADR
jgi:cyclic pyranopterin phosphate synthase